MDGRTLTVDLQPISLVTQPVRFTRGQQNTIIVRAASFVNSASATTTVCAFSANCPACCSILSGNGIKLSSPDLTPNEVASNRLATINFLIKCSRGPRLGGKNFASYLSETGNNSTFWHRAESA